jgi:hypothetical protein
MRIAHRVKTNKMEIEFNTNGNEKQKECCKAWLDNSISDIVYGGSKGSAKSFTGCSLIFGDALIYPGTHYFIARENLNDLRKFTLPSIYEVLKLWGISSNMFSFCLMLFLFINILNHRNRHNHFLHHYPSTILRRTPLITRQESKL